MFICPTCGKSIVKIYHLHLTEIMPLTGLDATVERRSSLETSKYGIGIGLSRRQNNALYATGPDFPREHF